MLVPIATLFGPSSVPPLPFHLKDRSFLLYASADTVTVLDPSTLAVVRVLAFWEAFPGSFSGDAAISNLAVDQDKQLVIATLEAQVGVWSCLNTEGTQWRVHSTLATSGDVFCIDSKTDYLLLGTSRAMTEYHLNEDGDLPTWTKRWSTRVVRPSLVRYSPNRTHIACVSSAGTAVMIYSTRSHLQTQRLRHPYSPISTTWRLPTPGNANRNDIILYTLTPDDTVRVYTSVLDAPDILQLHATIDRYGFMPDPLSSPDGSHVFWMDRQVVRRGLENALKENADGSKDTLKHRRPLLQQILDDGWDLFARILPDGSMIVRALANTDRRPPTLLKQFTILHTPPKTLATHIRTSSTHLSLHFSSTTNNIVLFTAPPFRTYELSALLFFDGQASGLRQVVRSWDPPSEDPLALKRKAGLTSRVTRFERTPEGDAITVSREDGSREIWTRGRGGRLRMLTAIPAEEAKTLPDIVCLFDEGRTIALYARDSQILVIKHFPREVTATVFTSCLEPIVQSVAIKTASDPVLFALPRLGDRTTPIACTTSAETTLIMVTITPGTHTKVSLSLQRTEPLPVPVPPELILPMDPMAWKPPATVNDQALDKIPYGQEDSSRNAFVSVSPEGELTFWAFIAPRVGNLLDIPGWRSTGRVHTQRRKIAMAQCSSAKKTALVVYVAEGQEVTIWDSTESEFSSGLEYRNVFDEAITDLDWTSTNDSLSILALGFAHKVVLLCPLRMSYFDERPTWGVLRVIDMLSKTPSIIGDSIWLADGCLLVAAGHQMCLFGESGSSSATATVGSDPGGSLFEIVAEQNGALDDFHPQLILQCLLWNKVDLVKRIITLLAHNVATARGDKQAEIMQLPIESFWTDESFPSKSSKRSGAEFLFNDREDTMESDETFSRDVVRRLTENLEAFPLPHLTPSEMEHLIVLIHTTLEIDEQRRSLDANGVRYLISMRSFFIINRRGVDHSGNSTPNSKRSVLAPFVRERIRYRDIVWAFHSESQEILMSASTGACGRKLLWLDARALGVFLWGKSTESLKAQMETIARNHYMAGDTRDPTSCCLFYFALGKVKLVQGLWKQAAWHKEQSVMLKFLSNDFTDPRWQTAALKNAFALLSKQRHEYAAAFFLLGGSLKDAVNVCLKQLADFQLAVALARVVEGDDGPVLGEILRNHVIPRAFREGNRWLGSWAFWMLKRRDLAVRILLTPLRDLAVEVDSPLDDIGDPHYDDPSLAVLFGQLKAKSLQTVKGTSEISGQTEFNFVHQMARVLCRMGCHVLALDLVRSWSFDRPIMAVAPVPRDIAEPLELRLQDLANGLDSSTSPTRETSSSRSRPPPSPTMRRKMTRLRRSSMIIDMELPSFPPTRGPSPPLKDVINGHYNGTNGTNGKADGESRGRAGMAPLPNSTGDVQSAQSGFGNLMKTAKKDVVVPEFDMSSFF